MTKGIQLLLVMELFKYWFESTSIMALQFKIIE